MDSYREDEESDYLMLYLVVSVSGADLVRSGTTRVTAEFRESNMWCILQNSTLLSKNCTSSSI